MISINSIHGDALCLYITPTFYNFLLMLNRVFDLQLQVTEALARAGLESSNLIVGVDFTKSNEWTGKILMQLFCCFPL